MSQRKPAGAVGSPMDDSLATVRVVTDTRAALIPHTGRRLVSLSCLTYSYPRNAKPGSHAWNSTYSARRARRSRAWSCSCNALAAAADEARATGRERDARLRLALDTVV